MADVNPYELLEIARTSTLAEIRRAYRLKALKCHPDKNPDNPQAAKSFLKLTKAAEILLDTAARAKYDKLLAAKDAARLRHHKLDDKRKKFKEDLEAREKASNVKSEEVKLENEIERLCKENAQLVQDENKRLNDEALKSKEHPAKRNIKACRLKVSWAEQDDNDPYKYTKDVIQRIFSKYGNIAALAVSQRKAIIEFEDQKAAELAIKIEVGYPSNKLKVTCVDSKSRKPAPGSRITDRDSESLSSRSKRQAEERRRLEEELLKEDK